MRRCLQMGLAVLLLSAGTATAGPTLFELAGTWRGAGLLRDDVEKPMREGRCRLSAMPLAEGREVRLKGRCATDRGSAEFSMRFVRFDGGAVAGGIATSLAPDSVQFVGRMDGGQVALHSREPVEFDRLRGVSMIVLSIQDESHFSLRQSLQTGGEVMDLMQMAFSR